MAILINTPEDYRHLDLFQESIKVLELIFRNRNHDRIAPLNFNQCQAWIVFASELKQQVKFNDVYSIPVCQAGSRMLLKIRESVLGIPLLLSVGIVDDSLALSRKALEQLLMLSYFLYSGDAANYFAGKYDTVSFNDLLLKCPANLENDKMQLIYKFLCDNVHVRQSISVRTLLESEIYNSELVFPKLAKSHPNLNQFNVESLTNDLLPLLQTLYKTFIRMPMYLYRFSIRRLQVGDYTNQLFRLLWQTIHQKNLLSNLTLGSINPSRLLQDHKTTLIARGICNPDLSIGPNVIIEAEKDISALCDQCEVTDLESLLQKVHPDYLDALDEASRMDNSGLEF